MVLKDITKQNPYPALQKFEMFKEKAYFTLKSFNQNWNWICNYTIKLAFLLHNCKKRCKRDEEQNYAVGGQLTVLTGKSRDRLISKLP